MSKADVCKSLKKLMNEADGIYDIDIRGLKNPRDIERTERAMESIQKLIKNLNYRLKCPRM